MANSEKSKLKILLIYDYFLRHVHAYDDDSAVQMGQIQDYLQKVTGSEFERKSVYADIKRLNEFVEAAGLVAPGHEWITLNGRKYTREELNYELTLDEARLIVDAIRTTPFTDSGLCEKIERRYPAYFKNGYKSLVSHDNVPKSKTKFLLTIIRTCIESRQVFCFKYGYDVAGGLRAVTDKTVSPLELDWENGNYYLIAVDNDIYAKCNDVMKSIRRYRIDRMKNQLVGQGMTYCGFESEKSRKEILDAYLKNSIDAYSSEKSMLITIMLEADDEKTLLRAYNAFASDVNVKNIILDQTSKGIIEFVFEAGLVPTLFTQLFKLYTFDGIKVTIKDEVVRSEFKKYLRAALEE